MSSFEPRGSSRLCLIAAAALAIAAGGCGDSDHHSSSNEPATVAVLSAFPAELAAVLSHVTVTETRVVDDHIFRIGTLDGQPVIAAMTGIGLINAAATTNLLLDNFEVSGVIVSGVAASTYHIGDIVVPELWSATDGSTFPVDPDWLDLAKDVASSDTLSLQQCTVPPMNPTQPEVCVPDEPVVVVGGVGRSADPFNGKPLLCTDTGHSDVFGCDVPTGTGAAAALDASATEPSASGAETPVVVNDEETAAIAEAASRHGVRFIAFRAASDQGSFNDFFIYYRLAAHNAAEAAAAMVGRL